MFRLALRSARSHWRRFVLTAVAVLVGVSFVVGSFVLTDSLAASIDKQLADATTHTDFVARPAAAGRGGQGGLGGGGGGGGGFGGGGRNGSRASVPSEVATQLADVPGVAAADPVVAGVAQLLDKAGRADAFDLSAVTNWPAHPDMAAVHLLRGAPPAGPDDVVIDERTADERDVDVGRTVRIGTRRGVVTAKVSGVARLGSGNLGAAGKIVAFTLERTTELVGNPGKIDSINIRLVARADRAGTQALLAAAGGPTIAILSADTLLADARARIEERLSTFNGLMLGFAGVTVFVSAFLVWNTFSMVIAQRRRELALLRAVGATARRVSRSVIVEAAFVGTAASGAGLGVGVLIAIGLRKLLGALSIELPSSELVVSPRTVAVAIAVGLGVTLVSVIVPARRATRIPPVAAMQSAATPLVVRRRRGPLLGAMFLVVGIALAVVALADTSTSSVTSNSRLLLVAGGAALVFIGVVVLAHRLTAPVIGALGRPLRRAGGMTAKLAIQNAARDPRRTASTASALTVGLMLVATTAVLGESIKSAYGGALRSSITADAIVDAGGLVPFDDDSVATVRRTAGVTEAVGIEFTRAQLRLPTDTASPALPVDRPESDRERTARRIGLTTGDVAAIARAVDPAFISGSWPSQATQIVVSKAYADDRKVGVGDTITLQGDTTDRVLTITGIYRRDELLDTAVVLPAALGGVTGAEPVSRLLLVSTSGSTARVVRDLAKAVSSVPNSAAWTADGYVTEQTNSLDVVLAIVDVLLLFAVAVAGMGIANTLALSVVERTRELGLLRAVGMTRRSVRRMVRIEGVLVALFGGVLGVVLGIAFGAATAQVLPTDQAELTFPVVRLVEVFVAAGVLGVIASAVPARRAARLDVLDAIAED